MESCEVTLKKKTDKWILAKSHYIFGYLRIELFTIAKTTVKPLIFALANCRSYHASFFHDSQIVVDQREWVEWKVNQPKTNVTRRK